MGSLAASLFASAIPLWEIALRTSLCYIGILVLLRLGGKREIGQITTFDVVVLLMIGNAVQNAMVGPDSSVIGGVASAAVLVGASYLTAALGLRSPLFQHAVRGEPTLLVNNGQFIWPNLRREGVDADEVLTAMREHGIDTVSQVKSAVLEIDGSISVIPEGTSSIRTRPVHHVRFLQRRG
jgi:uncharacterized membrane protein YcaP (DUF421 family)